MHSDRRLIFVTLFILASVYPSFSFADLGGAAFQFRSQTAAFAILEEDPLSLGNPSGATTDTTNETNFLMVKTQYSLSYNRSRASANWVAWRISSFWLGNTVRQDNYRADTTLPVGWYQVTGTDYAGSGYDRGHMCPSADRTNSIESNSATFLMTNMVPQLPENNQGSWAAFEDYLRTIATAGNEIYVFSGGYGNVGSIAGGRVVIPAATWKVVLILPEGIDDISRIDRRTRAFGIIVPNQLPLTRSEPWRNFRVTVDAVENITGYNFFSLVPINTQRIIESRRDLQ